MIHNNLSQETINGWIFMALICEKGQTSENVNSLSIICSDNVGRQEGHIFYSFFFSITFSNHTIKEIAVQSQLSCAVQWPGNKATNLNLKLSIGHHLFPKPIQKTCLQKVMYQKIDTHPKTCSKL